MKRKIKKLKSLVIIMGIILLNTAFIYGLIRGVSVDAATQPTCHWYYDSNNPAYDKKEDALNLDNGLTATFALILGECDGCKLSVKAEGSSLRTYTKEIKTNDSTRVNITATSINEGYNSVEATVTKPTGFLGWGTPKTCTTKTSYYANKSYNDIVKLTGMWVATDGSLVGEDIFRDHTMNIKNGDTYEVTVPAELSDIKSVYIGLSYQRDDVMFSDAISTGVGNLDFSGNTKTFPVTFKNIIYPTSGANKQQTISFNVKVTKSGTSSSNAPKVTITAPTFLQQFVAGTTKAELKVTTDIEATCYAAANLIDSQAGKNGKEMTSSIGGKSHKVEITGLVVGNNTRAVTCTANGVKGSATRTFTVASPSTTTTTTKKASNPGVTTYTITFESNGGSSISSKTVNKGDKVSRPADPSRQGYIFQGWFTDTALSNEYDFTKSVNSNLKLYAKWLVTVSSSETVKEETKNAYRWAQPNAYVDGKIGACGDAVFVTTCESSLKPDSQCIVTEINGLTINTTTHVHRQRLGDSFPVACGKIIRYANNTSAYSNNPSISGELQKLECGSKIVLDGSAINACQYGKEIASRITVEGKEYKVGQYCKATYDDNGVDKTIYVDRTWLTSTFNEDVCIPTSTDPRDPEGEVCESSIPKTNVTSKEETQMKICYTYSNGDTKPVDKDENNIYICAKGYKPNMRLEKDTCADLRPSVLSSQESCYKIFNYSCLASAKKPWVSGSGSMLTGSSTVGTITFTGHSGDSDIKLTKYAITRSSKTPDSNDTSIKWNDFTNNNYRETLRGYEAGSYFVWVMDELGTIGHTIMLVVHDADITTTISGLRMSNPDGTDNYSLMPIGGNNSTAYLGGVTTGNVDFMSNSLNRDSLVASGFDLFTTAYELTVESKQIAVYATLTSDDAKYVEGYEPRTVDLDYGRNEILIKVENKKGKVRTYTFVVTRNDNRESVNTLTDLTVSKGKINFDSYVSDYTVSVPKNTKTVSINGTLKSMRAAFVEGYEPRIVPLNNDVTSAVLKTMSEAGTVRNYVITFIKTGAEQKENIENSTYLSSLTIPGTQLLFDKKTTSYSLAVDYEVTNLPIHALPESNKANVNVSGSVGLKVGANLIEIMVTNGSKSKLYTVYVNRKQDGLGISEDTTLGSLTVKDYNINFNPEVKEYSLKIKREKTLLLSATPNSDRSEVYMYGNNDLTTFSSIRVKVIAENGDTGLYSLDITKDVYNKSFEITAAIVGGIIIVGGVIIIVVRKRRKLIKDYVGE